MLEKKVRAYFECEYNLMKAVAGHQSFLTDNEIPIRLAIQRCLGVTQFAQGLGDDFTNIEPLYEEYKKKFEELLH